jgi:hypothetical protein
MEQNHILRLKSMCTKFKSRSGAVAAGDALQYGSGSDSAKAMYCSYLRLLAVPALQFTL